MPKHDAVDRLMALATEKRADRVPKDVSAATTGSALPMTPALASVRAPIASEAVEITDPEEETPAPAQRGRQIVAAVRPLLPAVAGALRLVDHGAAQALARLLPLLGGGGLVAPAGASPEQEKKHQQALAALQSSVHSHRQELDALKLDAAKLEDELRRNRSQLERLSAEESGRGDQLRSLSDRNRLLTAAVIILFMLMVAQMFLLVLLYHK